MTTRGLIAAAAAVALSLPAAGRAQAVLFADDFDSGGSGVNWTATVAPTGTTGVNEANFAFDYSTVGIPSAPNSTGGTTIGMQLRANRPTGAPPIFSGISASPNGQSFTGDYTLRFDAWQNSFGPFPNGGQGSTQMTGGGIGAITTNGQFPGSTIDGLYFAASGEGGTATDYRAYANVGAPLAETSGVYAAGNVAGVTNNTHPYYTANNFGSVDPPAAQTALFPATQTGTTNPGTQAFEWHTWTIAKVGNIVTWSIRNRNGVDVPIATVDATAEPFAGDNIFLGQFDINNSATSLGDGDTLLFGLIDNVSVTAVPEPSSLLLAGLAVPAWLRLRRRGR